ncbi:hypothetical protein Dimus_019883 [Dionaea muscipula]
MLLSTERSFNPEEDAKAWAGEKNDKYREQKMSSHDAAKIRGKSFNPEGHVNTWIGEKNEKLIDDTTSRIPAENREKSFNPEEDGKAWSGRKNEQCREQKTTSCDPAETQEKSSIQEEDGNTWTRDANEREVGHSTRSRSPEKSGTNRPEAENFEMDYDRSSVIKRKEPEKDACKDERVKSRADGWGDRNRDREGLRDNWKRRQPFSNDKEDGDVVYDHDREWELPRRGRDRIDNERPLGRSGNRREGRSEAVKASSNTGISTENYDVIEIQPNLTRRNQAPGESSKEWQLDEGAVMLDHNAWRDDADSQEEKTRSQRGVGHPSGGQSSSSGSQPPYENHEPSSLGRTGMPPPVPLQPLNPSMSPAPAPSRGEQNDYSQNFVDTGMRPQNLIRELELTNVEDYPKLRELIQKKDEIVAKSAAAPMYYKCDLREFVLSSGFLEPSLM